MISILIVNWNGARFLQKCLQSIQQEVSGDFEVIVVDNASTDGSPELIATNFPSVKLIRNPGNVGFGRANNLAAQHAAGNVLLLLNYDTELLADPRPMAEALLEDPIIGCIGARMCNGEGVVVQNCGHFPTPLRLLLFSSQFWNPYQGVAGPPVLNAQRVDWVEGSWLLIRRATWDRLGGFDPEIFLYGEDVDLSRRVAGLGLTVLQSPVVAYRHDVGWSVQRLPYQFAGFRHYHRRHSSRAVRALAELILYSGLKLRLITYAVLARLTQKDRFQQKTNALRRVNRLWDRMEENGFGQNGLED